MPDPTPEDEGVSLLGRLLHAKELRLTFGGGEFDGYTDFKAPRGSRFAVIVVGVDECNRRGMTTDKTNPNEFLESLGWKAPDA